MSNDNREYPAWLDEELFASLQDAPAPAEAKEPPAAEDGAAPPEAKDEKTPEKKKKNKTKAASEPEKKKAKKADKAADEPAKKKAKKADKAADEPAKKKAKKADKAADEPTKKKAKKADKPAADEQESAPAPAAEDGAAPVFPDSNAGLLPEEKTEKEAPKKKEKKSQKGMRGLLIGLLGVVSLALIACIAAVAFARHVTHSDTNMPNVFLGEVSVGGLTKEQTLLALEQAKWEETRGGTLTVSLPVDVSFELDYLRAGACESAAEAAEAAFRYGHGEDEFENLLTYIHCMMDPVDLSRTEFTIDRAYVYDAVDKAVEEFETRTEGKEYIVNDESATIEFVKGVGQLSLDRDAICDRACRALLSGEHELEWNEIIGELRMPDFNALAAELAAEPVNAYYDPELDEIIPEIMGRSLDAEMAQKLWEQAGLLESVSMPITVVEPEITAESLEAVLFRDKLGDCLTYIIGSTPNRKSNIRLACTRFDGMVLQPGEQFSYNGVVGERTAEAGFKVAPVYSGTAHLDGLGGGICQVSSTLYNAALYAGLQIDERVCHTMIVGYLPLGLDATVDWPDTDFKFTNNRDYPVRLKAWVDDAGRTLTVEIWGTDVDGSYVDMLHYQWPAYDQTYRDQYGIDVQVGYGARSIRRTYHADGSYTDEDNVYSYYHIPEDEIDWPDVGIYEDDGGDEEG